MSVSHIIIGILHTTTIVNLTTPRGHEPFKISDHVEIIKSNDKDCNIIYSCSKKLAKSKR